MFDRLLRPTPTAPAGPPLAGLTLTALLLAGSASALPQTAIPAPTVPGVGNPITRAEQVHVFNRFAFGPTPSMLRRITTDTKLDNWFATQLNAPQGLSNPNLLTQVQRDWIANNIQGEPVLQSTLGAQNGALPLLWTRQDLEQKQAYIALRSRWQLREVMTQFWEAHFSTNLKRVSGGQVNRFHVPGNNQGVGATLGGAYEWHENRRFRATALTSFEEVLRASYESAAMRIYLHATGSYDGRPNEDYPREFLELHTMGDADLAGNPNYSNDLDIQEITRLMKGAGTDKFSGKPIYSGAGHILGSTDPVTLFATTNVPMFTTGIDSTFSGQTPPAPTENMPTDIEALLQHILDAPQTKEFICAKLIEFFVGERPSLGDPLLVNCLAAWDATPSSGKGNIRAILQAIYDSDEFGATDNPWARIENPFESAISQARILEGKLIAGPSPKDASNTLDNVSTLLSAAGQPLFAHPSPDGYPIESQRQIGSTPFLSRYRYAYLVYDNFVDPVSQADNLTYDPASLLQTMVVYDSSTNPAITPDFYDADQVVSAALNLICPDYYTVVEETRGRALLDGHVPGNEPGLWSASLSAAEQQRRLRLLCSYISIIPQASEK